MAKNNRTPLQIRQDRHEITQLYLTGNTQQVIADKKSMTREMVAYDLKAVQREWRKDTVMALDIHKAEELAKIDHLEAVAWNEWERSKADKQTWTIKQVGPVLSEETTKIETAHTGNPTFLDMVFKCIDRRCRLLGLDPKEDPTAINTQITEVAITINYRDPISGALLDSPPR